jgi:hypothetical protein
LRRRFLLLLLLLLLLAPAALMESKSKSKSKSKSTMEGDGPAAAKSGTADFVNRLTDRRPEPEDKACAPLEIRSMLLRNGVYATNPFSDAARFRHRRPNGSANPWFPPKS